METSQKKQPLVHGIIFVDKQSLYIYFEKARGVYKLDLKPEIVFDLEIVNEDLLSQTISAFLKANTIPPLTVGIVLSPNILFVKDFSQVKDGKEIPKEEYNRQIQQFTDNVPFEDPVEKRYPLSKTSEKIVVINSNFVNSLKQIFSDNGCTITSSNTPFDKGLEIFISGYSDSGIKNALGKIKSLRSSSLESDEKKLAEVKHNEEIAPESGDEAPQKKITPKTIGLISILGVLMLVLLGISYKTFVLDASSPIPPATPTPEETVNISPQQVTITPEASISKNIVTILVQNGSGVPQEASKISDLLNEAGFTSVTISNTSESPGAKNRIVYKSSLSQGIKNEITDLMNKSYSNITIVETGELSNDVVITVYDISGENANSDDESAVPQNTP